ncbi:MAG: HAMP domain-containing histidine kinase [Candidatus Cloacimonetes bacterium]|nr:HAMP domain-containing histidine kinase [Candidatus Cloacimonadota bacterium]
MKFGILRNKAKSHRLNILKIYFIAGITILIFLFIFYTNYVLQNIRKDVKVIPDLYSKFIGLPDNANLEEFLLQYFMEEIIPQINYPLILADSLKVPFSWENIDVPKDVKFEKLSEYDRKYILKLIKKMESTNNMIPLRYDKDSDKIFSYVFFGESKSLRHLKVMPYVESSIVILFMILGIYGMFSHKKNEENMLWVGLAKETAHQFGTPISSLLGWLDIISMKIEDRGSDEEMITMLNYMKTDIDHLYNIASRFGKVGSSIKRTPRNLNTIIQETAKYFKTRLPSLGAEIELIFQAEVENCKANVDPDLFKWTLENLIKNSIDAIQQKGGKITIHLFKRKENVHIQVIDTGIGLPKSMYKRIFYPGITSKNRGWGLGLSLAKRIIEEFHNGKIRVLTSEVGKGTTFEIVLKEEK